MEKVGIQCNMSLQHERFEWEVVELPSPYFQTTLFAKISFMTPRLGFCVGCLHLTLPAPLQLLGNSVIPEQEHLEYPPNRVFAT